MSSTNEENKNGDVSEHDRETFETLKSSEKTRVNLTGSEDGISKGETRAKKDNILSSLPGDGNPEAGNPNFLISGTDVSDDREKNQTGIVPSPSNGPPKTESSLHDNSQHLEMSRSSKSKVPTIRSNLPVGNSKGTGELTGQPSVNKNKEDAFWKNREQELLGKIVALEDKVKEIEASKNGKPIDEEEARKQEKLEKLEKDLSTVTQQREHYKNRLEAIEKELEKKSKDGETNDSLAKNSDEIIHQLKDQNKDLRDALTKMTTILKDKSALCVSQEKKMAALNHQVDSLKEVVSITKDLLNIRNMEVQHLSADISVMETKIDCERQRHNQMLVKMDEAVKLNTELKREYESQLKIFKDLRENYEEKVRLLSGGECTILEKGEEQTTGSKNDKSSTVTPNTEISDHKR